MHIYLYIYPSIHVSISTYTYYTYPVLFVAIGAIACANCGSKLYYVQYGVSQNVVTGIQVLGKFINQITQLIIGIMIIKNYVTLFILFLYYSYSLHS